MSKDIIIIDGVRYHSDRPSSCRGCYFWKNRKVGCTLGKENCYYLAESPKKKSPMRQLIFLAEIRDLANILPRFANGQFQAGSWLITAVGLLMKAVRWFCRYNRLC